MMDTEQKWDRQLNIRTTGRDDSAEDRHHFPYEPTPYAVLEKLAASGWIGHENCLVDYGCGKGRVSIFLSSRSGCRSIGIDFNEGFLQMAETNQKAASIGDGVLFQLENAERYEVPADADRFYFFNPFSVKVLQSVVGRILQSWYTAPRQMLLMFYYPSDEYVAYLMGVEELMFLDEIDCSDLFPGDRRERIVCFEIGGC